MNTPPTTRIVYNFRDNHVLALAMDTSEAHAIAETMSHSLMGTALYGACGIELTSHAKLCQTEAGRYAWNEFIRNI